MHAPSPNAVEAVLKLHLAPSHDIEYEAGLEVVCDMSGISK